MAAHAPTAQFVTISVSTAGDTLVTRDRAYKIKNMGANIVSIGPSATLPTAAVTAGDQTSLNPVASTGPVDGVILFPNRTYSVRAVSGATLCCLEEIPLSMREI